MNKYPCPGCQKELVEIKGCKLRPDDGVTLSCSNLECQIQDVEGYGRNVEAAYKIITEKYNK